MSSSLKGLHRSSKTGNLELYESSYELRRFIFLDGHPDVEWWSKNHGISIAYPSGKKTRRYIPDILVKLRDGRRILEEVKGYRWDRVKFGRKNAAALDWCRRRKIKFVLIFEEDLERLVL